MTRRSAWKAAMVAMLGCAALAVPRAAQARITRIEITQVESPAFGGASFGEVASRAQATQLTRPGRSVRTVWATTAGTMPTTATNPHSSRVSGVA